MKKFNYVYISTNLINGKQYIGDRSCDCDPEKDGYLGSGRPYFKNAKKKYGKENFKKEILETFETKQEAFDSQEKYIKQYNTLVPMGYNISPKGGHGVKGCWSEISKQKMKKPCSEETKEKIRKANKGQVPWNKDKKIEPRSKETKEKISRANKGYKFTKEQRKKVSDGVKSIMTDEYKCEMSERSSGKNNAMYGKSFYDIWVKKYGKREALERKKKWKENLSKSHKGKSTQRKPILCL